MKGFAVYDWRFSIYNLRFWIEKSEPSDWSDVSDKSDKDGWNQVSSIEHGYCHIV